MSSRHLLALPIAAMACLATAPGFAADRSWTLPGDAFAVSSPCAALVTVVPGSARGTVAVHAQATRVEEIARLLFEAEGGGTVLHPHPPASPCWRPADDRSAWAPTLTLTVTVPPGSRLRIDDAGQATYRIGAIGGPLAADLAGDSTLEDAAATATSLDLAGETRLTLHHVAGALLIDASGDTAVTVDEIEASEMTLDLAGASHITTTRGAVGSLAVDAGGRGTIAIGGRVARARVDMSGDTHLRIANLAGPIERDVSGVATVATGP